MLQQPVWANVHGDLRGLLSGQSENLEMVEALFVKLHGKLQHRWEKDIISNTVQEDKSSHGEC